MTNQKSTIFCKQNLVGINESKNDQLHKARKRNKRFVQLQHHLKKLNQKSKIICARYSVQTNKSTNGQLRKARGKTTRPARAPTQNTMHPHNNDQRTNTTISGLQSIYKCKAYLNSDESISDYSDAETVICTDEDLSSKLNIICGETGSRKILKRKSCESDQNIDDYPNGDEPYQLKKFKAYCDLKMCKYFDDHCLQMDMDALEVGQKRSKSQRLTKYKQSDEEKTRS